MKFLFDYFPIVCFFIAFKFYGIFVATAVAMAACALQNLIYWFIHRRFEKLHLITMATVFILGGFTLLFHKPEFIQWKPTIIYWVFSMVLLGSHWIGKKSLLFRMLGNKISLPEKIWFRLSIAWALFFLFLGILNIYVMYHYSLNAWVNFKLFGTLGLTLLFVIAQTIYMSKHMESSHEHSH